MCVSDTLTNFHLSRERHRNVRLGETTRRFRRTKPHWNIASFGSIEHTRALRSADNLSRNLIKGIRKKQEKIETSMSSRSRWGKLALNSYQFTIRPDYFPVRAKWMKFNGSQKKWRSTWFNGNGSAILRHQVHCYFLGILPRARAREMFRVSVTGNLAIRSRWNSNYKGRRRTCRKIARVEFVPAKIHTEVHVILVSSRCRFPIEFTLCNQFRAIEGRTSMQE